MSRLQGFVTTITLENNRSVHDFAKLVQRELKSDLNQFLIRSVAKSEDEYSVLIHLAKRSTTRLIARAIQRAGGSCDPDKFCPITRGKKVQRWVEDWSKEGKLASSPIFDFGKSEGEEEGDHSRDNQPANGAVGEENVGVYQISEIHRGIQNYSDETKMKLQNIFRARADLAELEFIVAMLGEESVSDDEMEVNM